jgi:hypothetical protein
MLQWDDVVMVEMKVLLLLMMMMVMMIPMKSSAMMTIATISPLQKGISSADFLPAEAAESISDPPVDLGFRG